VLNRGHRELRPKSSSARSVGLASGCRPDRKLRRELFRGCLAWLRARQRSRPFGGRPEGPPSCLVGCAQASRCSRHGGSSPRGTPRSPAATKQPLPRVQGSRLPFWTVHRTVYPVMGAPEAILIAGANGSGKTTFARQVLPLIHPTVPFLNATRFGTRTRALHRMLQRREKSCVASKSPNRQATRSPSRRRCRLGLTSRRFGPGRLRDTALSYTSLAFRRRILPCNGLLRVLRWGATASRNTLFVDVRAWPQPVHAVYKFEVSEWYQCFSDSKGLSLVATH
jgi:hypothetical protein